jgi:cyclic-di-GMP phosphodiesterase, flagellum assembly factor TipF
MKSILVFLGSLSIVVIAGAVLWWSKVFSNIELGLISAFLLLGFSQVAMQLRQARDRAATRHPAETEVLTTQVLELRENATVWAERITQLENEIETVARARNDQLIAEMQMVETLVKQLAERVATSGVKTPNPVKTFEPQSDEDDAILTLENQTSRDAKLLKTIRASLDENRVDLYLQPIVTLPQRKTRYYEALSRLRDDSGKIIMPDAYMKIAEPAGMMPMIDNILLFRCVHVMRKMVERNREVGVFCNVSATTLLDSEFFPQFIDYMKHNQDLAGSLIFEFGQSTIGGSGPLEFESLKALSDLGFTFSMDKVDRLDVDFQVLADMNFRFFKVPAEMFLNNVEKAGSPIHADDFAELLERNGITLIIEKIEDERSVVNLLDYNVTLAQGYHFSEPRPVRGDILLEALPEVGAA